MSSEKRGLGGRTDCLVLPRRFRRYFWHFVLASTRASFQPSQYFNSTFRYNFLFIDRVEPTVAPENFIVVEDARINDDVSASIAPTVHNDYEEYQRNNFPFHLFRFSRWFSSILSHIVVSTKTVTKTKVLRESPTNTVIYQQTSTFTQTATVVNTVFIQRCTPSPFPFSLCRNRRM